MAWQQRRNEFTDIRGFFYPLLTTLFRRSQPFWRENLISDSFHLLIASLANLKVLEIFFCTAVGASGNLWKNRRNKGADIDTENARANWVSVCWMGLIRVSTCCMYPDKQYRESETITKDRHRWFVQDEVYDGKL